MTESATRSGDSDPRFLAPVREGETVAGKYLVGRLLGLGGMGAVFEAFDSRLERRVALKVLLPRLVSSATAAQRFVREARAATRITSEHVVKLLEIETLTDGTPLLVMEYLEGVDLRALLREGGPLEPRRAVDYLLQALQAVAEGHMQAIVHRDLKPSNLFLTERADGTHLIKVLDFGIAKTLGPGVPADFALTSSEDMQLGSPTYMPPEQFQNPRDVDARADIWALGVTLYELISGRVPFQGQSYAELVSQVLSGPPDSLKTSLPGASLPAGLEGIVGKCLEKKRELRYANAVELAIALAPFGSEDAQLSLTRVSGLSRPRTPNPTSPPRESNGPYEATLPVPMDHVIERSTSQSASGARAVKRATTRNRTRLVFGAIALAALLGALVWLPRRATPPHAATSTQPTRPLAPSLSALQPVRAQAQAQAQAQPSTNGAAGVDPVVVEPAQPLTSSAASKPGPPRPGPRHGSLTSSPGLAPASNAAPSEPSAPPKQSEPEASADPPGTSALIESLIKQRH
ncbi:MAG: protein kinase [Pseudomonadota bacterium]